MKTALYYSDAAQPGVKLTVLGYPAKDRVDLGRIVDGKPVPVVTNCRVSDKPTTGQAVLEPDAPAKPADPKK